MRTLLVKYVEFYKQVSVAVTHLGFLNEPDYTLASSARLRSRGLLLSKTLVWHTEGAGLDDAWCTTWYSSGGLCEGLSWASKISTGIFSANLSTYTYWQGLETSQPKASSYLVAVLDGVTATPSSLLWAVCHVEPFCLARGSESEHVRDNFSMWPLAHS